MVNKGLEDVVQSVLEQTYSPPLVGIFLGPSLGVAHNTLLTSPFDVFRAVTILPVYIQQSFLHLLGFATYTGTKYIFVSCRFQQIHVVLAHQARVCYYDEVC